MKKTKQTFLIFWSIAREYKAVMALMISLVIFGTLIDLIKPLLLKLLFDSLLLIQNNGVGNIWWVFWIFIGIGFIRYLCHRILEKQNNYFQPRMISNLIHHCYSYLLGHSQQFYADNFVGSLQSKVKKFAGAFEHVGDQVMFDMGRSLLLLVLLTVITLITNWQFGLIYSVWLVCYLVVTYKFAIYKLQHDEAHSKQDTKVNGLLSDSFANHSVISLFAAENQEKQSFAKETDKLYLLKKKCWDYGWIANVFQGLSMIILEIIVLGYSIQLYIQNQLSVGDLIFLQAYLGRIFDNTWSMGRYVRQIFEKLAEANEMTEMLTTPHEVQNAIDAKPLVVSGGRIEFKNVWFKYNEGSPVLKDLSFVVPKGKKVALVGTSGGGKSTIIKALLRVADVESGQILVDGQDISKVTLESLHQSIVPVLQDTSLFHSPIYDNIKYGSPEAGEEEVLEASKLAHCHEFISKLSDKYHTYVGERGVKLSGGQRQRVAIARAFLRNSPILILDEATSSLDSESEQFIQASLQELMNGRTTIVIAHRLSTIKKVDLILVIEDGKIIEEGTHDSLMQTSTKYRQLWEIQVGGFESASATAY